MSTPNTTEEDIAANAGYHAELLAGIAALDYAPAALASQTSYVTDLKNQTVQCEKKLQQLGEKTKKERKEHEALRDSTTRRLAHKLTGRKEKFEAMESKEEREFVEALERELTERDNLQGIREMLAEAEAVHEDLKEKATRHQILKVDLANLYSRVFDGPSEAFPEDDKMEYELDAAHRKHEQIQNTLNQESQAAQLLTKAVTLMTSSQRHMEEALSYSRWDMWGGGTMSDMMERNALRSAQTLAYQAENIVDQACRVSPQVQPVGRVNIAQGSVISDVFFDNIFTDMAFHNKIKTSATQVLLSSNRLKAERDATVQRAESAGSRLIQVAKTLETRRRELDEYRRATFESVASAIGQIPVERPPTYEQVWEEPPTSATADGPSAQTPSAPPPTFSSTIVSSPDPAETLQTNPPDTDRRWGSRNPYAAAIAERTRSMSLEA